MAIDNQKLRVRLDRAFSVYIRMYYATHEGYVECFTCGVIIPWQESDCGHFIDRQHSAVRFNEKNCRPQCYDCNRMKGGMSEVFEQRLRDDFGDEEIDKLIEMSRDETSYSDAEYKEEIHKYTLKVKEMGGTL